MMVHPPWPRYKAGEMAVVAHLESNFLANSVGCEQGPDAKERSCFREGPYAIRGGVVISGMADAQSVGRDHVGCEIAHSLTSSHFIIF